MPSPTSYSAISSYSLSSNSLLNALLSDDLLRWGFGPGQTTLSYSFPYTTYASASWALFYDEPFAETVLGFLDVQLNAARDAFAAWSNVANIQFIEVEDTATNVGDIRLAFSSEVTDAWGWAYYPWSSAKAGDIWVNPDYYFDSNWSPGTYHFEALIHEIGHALSLKHSFEGPISLPTSLDFRNYTVMSYTDPDEAWYWDAENSQWIYIGPRTPMVYDILAIQHIYGANTSFRTGNDWYSFDSSIPFIEAIWDAGGQDTLDFSNFTEDSIINLLDGSYSQLGFNDHPLFDNLGIAFGSIIENAIGGQGNDSINGNAVGNMLDGGMGADRLWGGLGADTLMGGEGDDLFIFTSSADSTSSEYDIITDLAPGDSIAFLDMEGMDFVRDPYPYTGSVFFTLNNIENDTTIYNKIVYFTDNTDSYLYVKGDGTGESYDLSLIVLLSTTTPPLIEGVNSLPQGMLSIIGEPTQGETLVAEDNLEDADGLGFFTYRWFADGELIPFVTTDSLQLTQQEVGKAINVAVSYIDLLGHEEIVLSAMTPPVLNINDPPYGSVSITGNTVQGEILTAAISLIDDDGLGAMAFQWNADGLPIAGATEDSLLLTQSQVGQQVTLSVSYTDGYGANELVHSAPSAVVENINDLPEGSVEIIGLPIQGETLTATHTITDVDGLGTIYYQWLANGEPITAATGMSLVLGQELVGSVVQLTASYTDGEGTEEMVAGTATGAIENVNDLPTGGVAISGQLVVGKTLSASNTLADEDGLGDIRYQWRANGANIAGANSSTLLLTADLEGAIISVLASYTDGFGADEAVISAPSLAVTTNTPPTGTLTILGNWFVGETLGVSHDLEDADGLGAISFQWFADGQKIVGAEANNFQLATGQLGQSIHVVASYTDGLGFDENVASEASAPVGQQVIGTEGDDSLTGSAFADRLMGLGGNDRFDSGQGADHVDGGAGDDAIIKHLLPSLYIYDTGQLIGPGESNTLASIEYVSFGTDWEDPYLIDVRVEDLIDPDGPEGPLQSPVTALMQQINDLYIAFFDRAPRPGGLNYWFKYIYEGVSGLHNTAEYFTLQPEYAERYPDTFTNEEFVIAVFENLFDRQPASTGLAYWTNTLDTGALSRDTFIFNVIEGAYAPTGGAADRDLLNNKHEVSLYYVEQQSLFPNEGYDPGITAILNSVSADPSTTTMAKDVIDYAFANPISITGIVEDQQLWNSFWLV